MPLKLNGKQNRYLRRLGHHLKPVVMVGKEEINEPLVAAVDEALEAHELVKVKLQEGCLTDRKEVAGELGSACGAAVVQVLGRTILLYRSAENPRIELP